MKYAVIGAGAVGAVIGAFPAIGGQEVWFVDPFEAHMKAIAENGLRFQRSSYTKPNEFTEETVRVHAVTTADSVGIVDVAIVMVKSTFTEASVANLKKICDENTILITFQNGMGNVEILKEHFNPDNVAYGVTTIASGMIEPGVVRPKFNEGNHIMIGSDNKALRPRLEKIVEEFTAGNVNMAYTNDIVTYVWKKMVMNCIGNAIAGIVRIDTRQGNSYQAYVDLENKLADEVQAVAAAEGIVIDARSLGPGPKAHPYETSPFPAHYSSTCQDIKAHKKTEIDFLNGYIVKKGREHGIPTPYNESIWLIVKVLEQSYHQQF